MCTHCCVKLKFHYTFFATKSATVRRLSWFVSVTFTETFPQTLLQTFLLCYRLNSIRVTQTDLSQIYHGLFRLTWFESPKLPRDITIYGWCSRLT